MKLYLAGFGEGNEKHIENYIAKPMKLYLADTNMNHFQNAGRAARSDIPAPGLNPVSPGAEPDHAGFQLRILISYWYFRDVNLEKVFAKHFQPGHMPQVFADSGAFSAYNFGVTIKVKEYAQWLLRWRYLFKAMSNLDVKGNVEAGLENQAYLESCGLSPLPVFHGGEPWEVLEQMVDWYPYIALGGIAGASLQNSHPQVRAWLTKCFKIAKGKTVFHGFGMTNWEILKSYPWYSCDSSSWGQGFRFGECPVFDVNLGKFHKFQMGSPIWYKHAPLVRSYGFDPADFATKRYGYDLSKVCALAALSYMTAERWLERIHGPVIIPARTG